ncbi:protein FAM98B isoform X1 [Takifugu flavidus]|uniref:Protein FAM98B n=1 Tax=Takifugu flavidus TaxID=433684 RepID=A0A5C6PGA0_9TELE|nr:protein FAM98B isoform X1 [Takifugu flavidus]TWW77280.1 Protein FAM98B [Takifugu flavidus]
MERSGRTISAIKALGYPGASCLRRCECDELPCPLLTWLCAELNTACKATKGNEFIHFQESKRSNVLLVGELRNFLKDMFCPLTLLTSEVLGPSELNKVTDFLVSELLAAQIINHKEMYPEETTQDKSEKEQRVEDRSLEADENGHYQNCHQRMAELQAEWVLLLHALDMDTSSQLTDVLSEVETRLARLPGGGMTDSLLKTSLTTEQWMNIAKLDKVLKEDYQCRRQMMVKRFQVTLESFAWGEKQKERSEVLATVPPLSALVGSSRVSPSFLLVAREDQSFIQPVKAGRSTAIYKILMGSVPDRGGRPGEIEPPMPAWEGRRTQGNRWGRGSGRQRPKVSDKKKKGKKD